MRGRRSPPADLRGGSIARCSEEESFCKTAADELRHLWSREGDMDERPIDSPDLAWTDITANRSSMMSDTVWISIAMGHGTNLGRLRHSFSETDQRQDSIAWGQQNVAGEPLKAECFPSEIYGAPDAKDSDYRLPSIFYAGSFWAVSKAAADVLRQFDLGAGGLYPVKVFKKDRQTPLGDEWFCINFGNRKETVIVPESSTSLNDQYIRPGVKGWIPKFAIEDGGMAISKDGLLGTRHL